jgi:predicted nucleic acid-binding Zn ribbon protein
MDRIVNHTKCIGCGDLVDRDGQNDKVCSACRTALLMCAKEGFRPAFVVRAYLDIQRAAETVLKAVGFKEVVK